MFWGKTPTRKSHHQQDLGWVVPAFTPRLSRTRRRRSSVCQKMEGLNSRNLGMYFKTNKDFPGNKKCIIKTCVVSISKKSCSCEINSKIHKINSYPTHESSRSKNACPAHVWHSSPGVSGCLVEIHNPQVTKNFSHLTCQELVLVTKIIPQMWVLPNEFLAILPNIKTIWFSHPGSVENYPWP